MAITKSVNETAFDVGEFRKTLGKFATGVTVVSTMEDESAHGMTANSFTSVSLDPPLVLVSVDNRAKMKDLLQKSGSYGLSILTAKQEDVSTNFAGRPQDSVKEPFEIIDGVPLIKGALATLSCDVKDIYPAGDHTLFVAEVRTFDRRECEPLMFYSGSYTQRKQQEQVA